MADYIIVQGDDKHTRVEMIGTGVELVQAFYFTSKTLGINKLFDRKEEDGYWYIALTSEETRDFKVGVHSFDITVKTVDSDIFTALYHGTVCVKEKDNSIY